MRLRTIFATPFPKLLNTSSATLGSMLGSRSDPVKMKLIVLSSATKALELKRKNPDFSDDVVLSHISRMADRIIEEAK